MGNRIVSIPEFLCLLSYGQFPARQSWILPQLLQPVWQQRIESFIPHGVETWHHKRLLCKDSIEPYLQTQQLRSIYSSNSRETLRRNEDPLFNCQPVNSAIPLHTGYDNAKKTKPIDLVIWSGYRKLPLNFAACVWKHDKLSLRNTGLFLCATVCLEAISLHTECTFREMNGWTWQCSIRYETDTGCAEEAPFSEVSLSWFSAPEDMVLKRNRLYLSHMFHVKHPSLSISFPGIRLHGSFNDSKFILLKQNWQRIMRHISGKKLLSIQLNFRKFRSQGVSV